MFRVMFIPFIFIFPFALLLFVFWLWTLIDCIKSGIKETDKLIWILIIVFFNVIGSLIYLIFVKQNKNYRGFKIKMKNTTKKLYRSKKNRMIAGVCGGIAEYFAIDPTVVRLGWVLLTFLGGSGLLAYIICWIVIPERK